MKVVKILLAMMVQLLLFASCEIHQWPSSRETMPVCIQFNFDTALNQWHHEHSSSGVVETGSGPVVDNVRLEGQMRCIVHIGDDLRYVFYHDLKNGYDFVQELPLPPGEHNVQVWADMTSDDSSPAFYEASDFGAIRIVRPYVGSSDYRDAFRGYASLSVKSDIQDRAPDTLCVRMQRPLAKIELISVDLRDFISDDNDIKDYRFEFRYVGYVPDTYSIPADKPVDSSVGVVFESMSSKLNDKELSLGFDYVYVNHKSTYVTLQISTYDKEGSMVSLSSPINVPVSRDRHTIIRGRFLTGKSSGGVGVDPGYDNDFNVIIP